MFIITFTLPTYPPPPHPHILYAYIIFHVQGIFISDMVYIIFIYIYISYILVSAFHCLMHHVTKADSLFERVKVAKSFYLPHVCFYL